MSEITTGGERKEVEVVQTTLTMLEEDLEFIRKRLAREVKLVEATKRLVEAGREILELEDIHRIGEDVEKWAKFIPDSNIVVDNASVILEGSRIQFASDHPSLIAVNKSPGANCGVEAFDLASDRVVISGWAELRDVWEPKSIFACIIDTREPVQDTAVHVLEVDRDATSGFESQEEKDLISGLARSMEETSAQALTEN